jgi:hypothetical protein
MSKQNKVNKDRYTQAGRLTPDEMARERARAIYMSDTRRKLTGMREASHRGESAPSPAQSERAKEE